MESAFSALHVLEVQKGSEYVMWGKSDGMTFRLQSVWAEENGVSSELFRKAYDSPIVEEDLRQAADVTERYRVKYVPFFIVNGKYGANVGEAGGPERLMSLIGYLAGSEHQRR
ncbi:MAG TPA: hypothetical protein VFX20_13765 [Steroidobacteraceae bacterium]|nr:hypothetical protein [Steroidobacteraceae bacterium]